MAELEEEKRRFHSVTNATILPNRLIVDLRPERTALFLSIGLIGAVGTYILGDSVSTGIVIRLTSSFPSIKLCRTELGDVVGLPLWNGGGAPLRALVDDVWEVPTGQCICKDE